MMNILLDAELEVSLQIVAAAPFKFRIRRT
jgi:hypothetical protein